MRDFSRTRIRRAPQTFSTPSIAILLGQLLKCLNNRRLSLDALTALLIKARDERNRLSHSYYREHNFRRNSEEGRFLMLEDLETIHAVVIDAYKAVMALGGVDLDAMAETQFLTCHLLI